MLSKLLQEETMRLNEANISFNIYEMGYPGKVGITVKKDSNDYDENTKRITIAGYSYAGDYPKKEGYELYTISVSTLQEIFKIED